MSKNIKWALIFSAVLLVSLAVIFFGQFTASEKGAEIYLDGKLYKTLDSIENSDTRTLSVETDEGFNTVCYGGGKIWVEKADCKNQVCVKHAKASLVGETIICAPHKLLIKVVGGSDESVDAAA